jgi:4-hydroxy-2-oxoglutarate aldolase
MDKVLQGVIPPVATPFTSDEDLDLKAFKANMERWNQTGLSGYLVVGSNGESVFLTDKERDQLLEASREVAAPEKIIMAGTGAESTRATIQQTRRAAELGADCALVITPYYFKGQMTPGRLVNHFLKVADAATIPVLVYNFPQSTGLNLAPDAVAKIAGHPNVVGIKDSSGNIAQLSELVRLCPKDFAVFVGNAAVFYPALCLGAVGGILAVANVAPERCVELMKSFQAGEMDQAREQQWRLVSLAVLVTVTHGAGGLKAAMAMAGYQPGVVRSPLTMPDDAALATIQKELTALGY